MVSAHARWGERLRAIGAQSRDSENAQRNLEIAQILRLCGTYIPHQHWGDNGEWKDQECSVYLQTICLIGYRLYRCLAKLAFAHESSTTPFCHSRVMMSVKWCGHGLESLLLNIKGLTLSLLELLSFAANMNCTCGLLCRLIKWQLP